MAVTAAALVIVAVVVTATAATAFARHHVDHALDFLGRGFTCRHHLAHIVEIASGQRVIQVEFHLVFSHVEYQSLKTHALFVDQGQDGAGIDLCFVETSVDVKHLFGHLDHVFLLVGAERLFHAEREIEAVARIEFCHLGLESRQCSRKAGDELEGVLLGSFFKDFVDALLVVRIELISHGDIAIFVFCHVRDYLAFDYEFVFRQERPALQFSSS